MTPLVQIPNSSLLQLSTYPKMPENDFAMDSDAFSDTGSPLKGRVPQELTSLGTTPSGKPRLFVCNTCTRAFARLEHLRRHERSHTKEKPFTCGVCQRKFSRRDLLLRHAQKLHAGCSEAITRLRRKLLKSNSISSASDMYDGDFPFHKSSPDSSSGATLSMYSGLTDRTTSSVSTPHGRASLDSIQFNLNSFNNRANDPSKAPPSTIRLSRSNSVKDSNLQRQLFDRRKLRNRGASFSAQSGQNYAMAIPHNLDSNTADNVEFSTPQFLPTTNPDEENWLTGLCTIPGMSTAKPDGLDSYNSASIDNEIPKHTSMFGGGLASGLGRSESITSSNSVNTMDSNSGNVPFLNHKPSITSNPMGSALATPTNMNADGQELGYSFYDIPDNMYGRLQPIPRLHQPLSPIKQEIDDDMLGIDVNMNQDYGAMNQIPSTITGGVNFDMNFLNDIDDLAQAIDVGSRFPPAGYSFYGDDPSISSSGLDSNSPQPIVSPSSGINNVQTLMKHNQFATLNPSAEGGSFDLQARNLSGPSFNKTKLFTTQMRKLISKALSKYPVSDVMSPSIPSNDKLEYFLRIFVERFLSYSQFIHPSKLNEFEIMNMTSNEDPSNESARVCMPLLIATMGALLANNKNDSEHLYEASRRTIHIYLESRKNKSGGANSQPPNPLWLIQSLTLSVIYGLFSENENNVYIVIRQLNALNSLVKTLIKSNKEVLFSITGEDELYYNAVASGNMYSIMGVVDAVTPEDIKFRNNINLQSQTRIVFTIYQLTNFILMMFNVPLTLSANDLGALSCPNTNDEFLWSFQGYKEFTAYKVNAGSKRDLESYLVRDQSNCFPFKELLRNVTKSNFDLRTKTNLCHMSNFGFITMAKGIYELMQYGEFKHENISSVLDNLTQFVHAFDGKTKALISSEIPSEKVDYALLVNFVKICSIVDFALVKEQSWLRNYDELNKNFFVFLTSMESVSDSNFLKVIDYCIDITKLVLFKATNVENETSDYLFVGNNPLNGESAHLGVNSSSNDLPNGLEKTFGIRLLNEIFSTKTPIHSQILFHVFVIFSIFAIQVAKKNRLSQHAQVDVTSLNEKFICMLRILAKFEHHLKAQYENSKLDSELTNLFLFLTGGNADLLSDDPSRIKQETHASGGHFAYSMEKALYVLKVGELMMRFLYEHNIKVSIFKKLSGSMSQIRKYLIDEEIAILP